MKSLIKLRAVVPELFRPEWATKPAVETSQFASSGRVSPAPVGSFAHAAAKRAMDIVLSVLFLIIASPVLLAAAAAIKLESPGAVLFGHDRLGTGGRRFRCLKFRSMRHGAHADLRSDPALRAIYEQNDYKIPIELDPRITRVGRFLRRSSLDELPQLFNVLVGEMSLVGPRPIVDDELKYYRGRESLFLSVRPGITGEWQVQGRNRIGYPDRARIELDAIARRSFWRDLKILLRTIPAVITARGSL
jgi:lipopolysaccharide/colanic/teichoic acid biosynthesis glycosyltransferase